MGGLIIMVIEFPDFIGRQKEIERINRAINRSDENPFWIDIVGSGGVGKTTLLHHVQNIISNNDNIASTTIIDFAQIKNFSQWWVMNSISKIDTESFEEYINLASQLEMQKDADCSHEVVKKISKEQDAEGVFIKCASTYAQRIGRLVVMIDTLEYVIETARLYKFILSLFSKVKYLTLITAGRPAEPDSEISRDFFKSSQRDKIELKGFTDEDALLYFQKTIHDEEINLEDQRKLTLLTNGHPLKIAMSIQWFRYVRSLPIYSQKSYEEIKKMQKDEYEKLNNEFEHELLQRVRDLDDPLSDCYLKMAHVYRRFNKDLLTRLVKTDDIEKTLIDLKKSPFIKIIDENNFVLHDEVQRLIELHVWQYLDSEGERRREISKVVVEYYKEEIDRLEKNKRNVAEKFLTNYEFEIRIYRIEKMFYLFNIDLWEGFQEFDTLFEEFKNYHREELSFLATKFVKEYSRDLSALVTTFLNTYNDGWLQVLHQQYVTAEKIIEDGLRKLKILICEPKTDNKLDSLVRCRIGDVYNLLGFCHRSQGNLKEAKVNYEEAINELKKNLSMDTTSDQNLASNRKTIRQIAETMNNLSNVLRMIGHFSEARPKCHMGLLLRKAWGDSRDIGNSYYVLGKINWEIGGTAEAIGYFDLARKEFDKTDLDINKAWIDRYVGYVHYRIGLLDQAEQYIERARIVFEDNYKQADIAETLNDLARISAEKFDGKEFPREAVDTAEKALKIAKQIGDRYRESECYLTLANIYLKLFKNADNESKKVEWRTMVDKYVRAGSDISCHNKYNLFESIFSSIRGVLNFESRDYIKAFDQFLNSCKLAQQFKLAFFDRMVDTLGQYLFDLSHINIDQSKAMCEHCMSKWREDHNLDNGKDQLIAEIQEILMIIEETIKRSSYQYKFNEYIRLGQFENALSISSEAAASNKTYPQDEHYAQLLYDQAIALQKLHRYIKARRLCKLSLSIRENLKLEKETADSHYLLGNILWDLGNNKEAVDHIKQAKQLYSKNNHKEGTGMVHQFMGYLLSRVRLYADAEKELEMATEIFEKFKNDEGLTSIYNTRSRMARIVEKMEKEKRIMLAVNYAERALELSQKTGNRFQKGEILLSLVIVYYILERDRNDKKFIKAKQYYNEAKKVVGKKNPLLLSILQGVYANILCDTGDYTAAFNYFYEECKLAIGTKHMRLPRALEIMSDRLTELPNDEAKKICNNLIKRWKREKFTNDNEEFMNTLNLMLQYHQYLGKSEA